MLPGGQDGQNDPSSTEPEVIDLRLVSLAVDGDPVAFEELYRRHAPLARRVAWSVLRDDRDADDVVADAFERLLRVIPTDRLHDRKAFRAYLLVTTKHLALNAARQRGRGGPLPDDLEEWSAEANPLDTVVGNEEAVLMRRAFGALPERWRSVLWLTEVEGLPHKDAGELLGVSANGVSQLALRARAGLRESFLQANVQGSAPDECRFTRERLAAHAGGALPAAEAAEVERHLAECAACRDRFAEVVDLAGTLRHAGIPITLVLGLGGGLLRASRPRLSLISRRVRGIGAVATAAAVLAVSLALVRDPAPPIKVPAGAPAVVVTTTTAAPPATTVTTAASTTTAPSTTTTTTTTAPPPVAAAARPAVTAPPRTTTTLGVRVTAPAVDDDDDRERTRKRRGWLWCRRPGKAHDDDDPDRRRC